MPQETTATPAAETTPSLEPTTRARVGQTGVLLPLLAVLLCLASGIVGGLIALMLHAKPIPPPRFAVIDTAKIIEAVAEAAKRDDGFTRRWPERFDAVVEKLQADDPDLLILVREAVIGKELEDVTPVFLKDIMGSGNQPVPGRKSNGGR
jgi:hypothetical protein